MKKAMFITLMATMSVFAAILHVSCNKNECKDVSCQNGGSCNEGTCSCPTGYSGSRCETKLPGQVSFFTTIDYDAGDISVTINGETKLITSVYPKGIKGCEVSGCANFSLPAGTYRYQATHSRKTWNGDVTFKPGECYGYQLSNLTGEAVFWTTGDYGSIAIDCEGARDTITSKVFSIPGCGTEGCATITLPVGTYDYSAVSSLGKLWFGSVVINGGCASVRLN